MTTNYQQFFKHIITGHSFSKSTQNILDSVLAMGKAYTAFQLHLPLKGNRNKVFLYKFKAARENRGKTPYILNLAAKWTWLASFMLRQLLLGERTPNTKHSKISGCQSRREELAESCSSRELNPVGASHTQQKHQWQKYPDSHFSRSAVAICISLNYD
jgi:hypothetical protein